MQLLTIRLDSHVTMLCYRIILLCLTAIVAIGCQRQPAHVPASQPVANDPPRRLKSEHLPNLWQLHPKVISGGLPEGDAAFAELEKLGVKTVISVDGAKPDVELARKHGLRYVHLPHGYDGVPAQRMKELAKAVRDMPGPIYIHCHHGKHRSPTAAAVACVGAGLLAPSAAEPILVAAGTSGAYKGLYQSARSAQRFEKQLLDNLAAEFPESARLPPLAEKMVALEHTHDHVKLIAADKWQSPPTHPDLDPAHEALLLREHFTELLRSDDARSQPERFLSLLRSSEAAAQELEDALKAGKLADAKKPFDRLTTNCKSCHTAFRDVPLSEKTQAAH